MLRICEDRVFDVTEKWKCSYHRGKEELYNAVLVLPMVGKE
jgi:hypothetical protein